MKIDIDKKNNLYKLMINGDIILDNEVSLGICVDKIEQFLKMYFLKEKKEGVLNKLGSAFK